MVLLTTSAQEPFTNVRPGLQSSSQWSPIGVAHETQAILPFEVPQPVDHTADVF